MRRKLYVLMGAPASGKTTWLKENKLDIYSVSTDDLRMLYSAPVVNVEGKRTISQEKDRKVWNTFYDIIEERVAKGERTFADATNTTQKYWNKYLEIANRHNAEVICIDFSGDVTQEELKIRNESREEMKRVPEKVIEKMQSNIENMKWNKRIKRMTPEEYLNQKEDVVDLSKYENIYHIGDIHGSIEPLNEFLDEYFCEESFYIFTGDYVDRGLNNAEVVEKITELSHLKNVVVLEGNHERHLYRWTKSKKSNSRVFERFTKPELEDKGVSRRKVSSLFYRMKTKFQYHYDTLANILVGEVDDHCEKEIEKIKVVCTHGGISKLPGEFEELSASQAISGVGNYNEDIDEIFSKLNEGVPNLYQVHGHRNTHNLPIVSSKKSFNLDGSVEKGGKLRVLKLNDDGFEPLEFKNYTYSPAFKTKEKSFNNHTFLKELKSDNYIKEKKDKEISSFNFNKKVFRKGLWNEQRIKARGLFLDTKTTEIAARGYDKFFNIEEREETTLESLKESLEFPVDIYKKVNGFLGLVGIRRRSGELLITSKGDTKGSHSCMFAEIFKDKVSYKKEYDLYEYLDENNLSLAFEVVDPENDPHIIKYSKKEIILLDAIYREPGFKKVSYEELKQIGKMFGFKVKEFHCRFDNFKEIEKWYAKEMIDYENELEGYILEDKSGFLTKIKLPYYSFWKWTRGQMGHINKKGTVRNNFAEDNLGRLISPGLLRLYKEKPGLFAGDDIIKVRDELLKMGYNIYY